MVNLDHYLILCFISDLVFLFLFGIIWDVYGWSIIILDRKNLAGKRFQFTCSRKTREQIYALKIYLLFIWMSFIIFIWCAFDYAGRSWVKMKRFQESLNNPNSKHKYRRSNSFHRNWRHREALRKYEKSWINRCRMCCCIRDHRRDNSFADIAKLLSEFFRDIDVVPSDIIAGLSLMRVQQKSIRKKLFEDSINPKIFQFLSGTPITAETKFLDLTHPLVIKEIYNLIHYFHYSMAIYGWPVYMVTNKPIEWFRLIRNLEPCSNNRCHCCVQCFSFSNWYCCYCFRVENDSEQPNDYEDDERFIGDNCCLCNRAAIRQTCRDHHYKIIFLTYEVGVERPPFFVAVDYEKISIVISIRGTLSLSDVMTDLNADYEQLPIKEPKESWFGHKGIVSAASYIRSKLIEKNAIEIANEELKRKNSQTNCSQFPIIVVGHSLGAGTAAILAVLLREIYRNVICFAYAPPGGLLSEEVINYSKDFIVSIVLGKDLVPRLGLHQMEKLRFDLIKSIKHCDMSKWSIILKSCCLSRKEFSLEEFTKKFKMNWQTDRLELATDRNKITKEIISTHPNDESISLTVHTPLYPPGSIIHLVKAYPNKNEYV
ncbi:Sn1-specific diacylglycerol lipase alpha [Sarcoptes scabiei]|nr:Sn1-specific diacylglycerol lipase alpha [Sarcoptes scabiei]